MEGYENNPDYIIDVESRIPNADDFYQEYEYNEIDVTSGSDCVTLATTLLVACFLFSSWKQANVET